MNTVVSPPKRSVVTGPLLYGLGLLLVLISPILGLAAASVAAWNSLLAGSMLYMPLGLGLLLATVAVMQSRKAFDITLLGGLVLGVVAWLLAGALHQNRVLDSAKALAAQTGLMIGMLLAMIAVLFLVRVTRRLRRQRLLLSVE